MSFTNLLDQTAEIFTRSTTGVSALGNDVTTVASAGAWPCHIQPASEQEVLDDRNQQVSTHIAWFDADAPLNGADFFVIAGERFELVGEPRNWTRPILNAVSHQQCTVRRVTDGNTL